ncbi:MAG: protein kinase [Myxococcales bacterium]|nr:protein kinase [Myxococcales bacterium]
MVHDSAPAGASNLDGTLVADKYQILQAVASGGMGTVYRARHLQLDRDVAIKLMHARHFDNREYMARFRLEAQKAAGLEHPGIVEVRDFGEDEALGPYLEMELLTGFSLRELLQAVGPLPIDVVVHCIGECLAALHYAHGKGILHRDLKPANLFVARVGDTFQTKILDFGLAKAMLGDTSATSSETLTKTGVVLGTLTYMSPEHFADFKSVDQRTDLYSLAASAYELLTGRPVVSGTSFIECVDKVSRGLHRQHPAELRPSISPEQDAVIARALRVSRDERFADAEAMRVALSACARDPDEALMTLERLVVVDGALSMPRQTVPDASSEGIGFHLDAGDDDPTLLGRPVFDEDDAPTTVAASPTELEGVTVHVAPSLRPTPPSPHQEELAQAAALETLPGRPLRRRRRIPQTLWGAPIWFWAAALGLVIVLVSIVLARRAPDGAVPVGVAPHVAGTDGASAGPATHPVEHPAHQAVAIGVVGGPSDTSPGLTTPGVGDDVAPAAADTVAPGGASEHTASQIQGGQGVGPDVSGDERVDGDASQDAMSDRRPTPRRTEQETRPAAAPTATLDVNTIPSARVFLDGRDTGQRTPLRGLSVSPGRHVVELRVGTTSHRYPVVASPGESVRLFRVLPTE